jgi:hypothetical protein
MRDKTHMEKVILSARVDPSVRAQHLCWSSTLVVDLDRLQGIACARHGGDD